MRIIHCADLHLESSMNSNLDREKAKARRGELLASFVKMTDYAVENNVAAIIIAGDLFDTGKVSTQAISTVLGAIKSKSQITFYYLKGNHGDSDWLNYVDELPTNLKLFYNTWTTYNDGVAITGIELTKDNINTFYDSLNLDMDAQNILVLHGQIEENGGEINLRRLMNKGIDYLCLGHIHSYSTGTLDARGIYTYSGCLEPRGFDECGDYGFVLLDVDDVNMTIDSSFVPFATRKCHVVNVDITEANNNQETVNLIRRSCTEANVHEQDLVKIILNGNKAYDCELSTEFLAKYFAADYFYIKIVDETGRIVNYESFANDHSLKGEFVRLVQNTEGYSDEEKAEIVRIGIKALMGEDVI